MVNIVECPPVPEPPPAPSRPDPSSISPDTWRRFESAALAVVHKIQPTVSSEHLRAAVIDYIQRLFRFRAGCQVFPFGSVPLKTYLPDGDIDLTAFVPASSGENLAQEIHAILLSEEERKNTEFEVKDVQLINAEVKLVKCLVQDIVMDISFNQIGGLCTLCFLEKVDQQIGKNHLFKRSIILIKDWCYYESRILGAHHGLISTYALETLVLYIFHTFHKSLDGPLAVLYRFLDYYSKFDWDNKAVSLFGPVSLASLPELVTDPTDTHDDDFLQREEFLKECVGIFSVPPKNSEKTARVFTRKYLYIVDPLKQDNNLGRSVSKGNFYRICSAFDFGARKLGKILQMPNSSTVNELNQFFRNTLKRHNTSCRADVLVSSSGDGARTDHLASDSVSRDVDVEQVSQGSSPLFRNSSDDLSDQFNNISISGSDNHGPIKQNGHNSMAEHGNVKVSRQLLNSDAPSFVSSLSSSVRNGVLCGASTFERHAPQLFYHLGNGKTVGLIETAKYNNGFSEGSPPLFENSQPGGTINDIMSDLSGDFDTNFNNLLYAQGCQQDNPTNQFYYPMMAPPPGQYWNTRPSLGPVRKVPYGYAGMNGTVPGPPYPPEFFVLRPLHRRDAYMAARSCGTGSYIPDPNMHKGRPPAGRGGRGRNHFPPYNYQKFQYNVRPEMIPLEETRNEPPFFPGANDNRIPSSMDIPAPYPTTQSQRDPKLPTLSSSSKVQKDLNGNGFTVPQDDKLKFGTIGALPLEVPSKEHATKSHSASNNQASGPVSPISAAKMAGTGDKQTRNSQAYHLKDSGDFPPLSS